RSSLIIREFVELSRKVFLVWKVLLPILLLLRRSLAVMAPLVVRRPLVVPRRRRRRLGFGPLALSRRTLGFWRIVLGILTVAVGVLIPVGRPLAVAGRRRRFRRRLSRAVFCQAFNHNDNQHRAHRGQRRGDQTPAPAILARAPLVQSFSPRSR